MIYHYTSLSTLALILKSKKIRFTRLDCVDDIQESQKTSGIEFGKYFFVSCWTESEKEHIPLWHMYTEGMKGVRIGLPKKPFKESDLIIPQEYGIEYPHGMKTVLHFSEMFARDFCVMPTHFTDQSFYGPIDYVDSPEEVYRRSIDLRIKPTNHANLHIRNLNNLPRTKSRYWEFQQESRFVLWILPPIEWPQKNIASKSFGAEFGAHAFRSMLNGAHAEFTKFDLALDPDILDDIEVTLGPLSDASSEIVTASLLEKFTKRGKIRTSSLHGKVREKR